MSGCVSIVVLTLDKLHCTRRCLPTLLESNWRPLELVVVDNGSTDGTPEWLRHFAAHARARGVAVRLLLNPANAGCSTARNQGWRAAEGGTIAFCDNDVCLRSRGWIERLSGALGAAPDAAMAGPKLLYPFAPYNIQCAGAAVSRTGRMQYLGRGEPRDDPRFAFPREVQCLISACILARRAALDAAGGFDEAFNPVEYEDIDLCYRMRAAGRKILYVPGAEMYHFESVTTQGTPALRNTGLVIRHGLLFKERWRHMFAGEDGPPDSATRWRRIAVPPLSEIADPPVTG